MILCGILGCREELTTGYSFEEHMIMPVSSVIESTQVRAVVDHFMTSWIDGNLEGVMSVMADDAVFVATTGPEPGRSFRGLDEIGRLFASLVSRSSPTRMRVESTFVVGDTAIVLWTTTDTTKKAAEATMKGLDVFRVRNGLIVLKDAYRKSY